MTLTQWRESRGLSGRKLALELKVSHTWLAALEQGSHSPTLRTVDWIEAASGGAVTRLDWPREGGR